MRCSIRKGFLRNFANYTVKHLSQVLFLKEVAVDSANLLKKKLWHRCFPVNFAKFLRTSFLQNISGQLLLNHSPVGTCMRVDVYLLANCGQYRKNSLLNTLKVRMRHLLFAQRTDFRSSHPEVFLRDGVLKICSKFTGELHMTKCNFNKVALQLY